MLKIDNFKLGQILKIVTSSDRWSLTEHNGTITNAQLLNVMEKFNSSMSWRNFFQKFRKIADGGPRRKTEKFRQI